MAERVANLETDGLPTDWQSLPFEKCILESGIERKASVPQAGYKPRGRFPVVDQGSSSIAGYTDDEGLLHRDDLPLILFGDHTRIFKFLDFPFATGADGTKLFRANKEVVEPRFLYYAVRHLDIPSRGYNRHFKYLKEKTIPVPSDPGEQRAIAAVLSKIQVAVEVQEKIVSTLKELKAATMAKLFREGIVPGFMFDTHIFDKILDGRIDLTRLKIGASLFVTHVQRNEIEKCKDKNRREQLLQTFQSVPQTMIPTESFVLGTSELGGAKVNDDSSIFEAIKKGNPKHTEDALIAETCIKQNLTLVTEEKDLPKWVQKAGGEAISFEDFLARRWRRLKQTEIGEIPESWEVKELGILAEISTGTTPATDRPDYYVGEVPFIKTAEIDNNIITTAEQYVSSEAVRDYSLRIYPAGSIFLAMYGQGKTRGRASLLNIPAATTQNTAAIEPGSKLDSEFMWHYLLSQYEALRNTGNLGHLSHLNLGYVKALLVPVPPKPEQVAIREILSLLQKRLEGASKRHASLQSMFSSVLHLLMTGQVRVSNMTGPT